LSSTPSVGVEDFSIEKTSLVDKVVEKMLFLVAEGRFNIQEKIPSEKVLMKEFNVSRSTLRAAMKRLECAGLLSIRQGSGTILLEDDLTKLNLQTGSLAKAGIVVEKMMQLENVRLSHYLEARENLEIAAFEAACTRAFPSDLLNIESALDAHRRIVEEQRPEALYEVDLAFHKSMILASHNEFYLMFWETIMPFFKEQIRRVNDLPGMMGNACDVHEKIYNALVARSVKDGKKYIREHIGTISGRMISRAQEEYKKDTGKIIRFE